MIKKFIVYCLSFIVISLTIYHIPYTIYASESSPSADIKAKLEELKKEIASKAAKLKQEISTKMQNKAYIGTVKSKSNQSVTLATRTGTKMVSISQDTLLPRTIIKEEDFIAALGEIDETGVLIAKKIVLLPQQKTVTKTYLWGKIISISEKLVTLKNNEQKNVSVTVPNLSKINIEDTVILTGNENKNKIFEADFVYNISSPSAKKLN